ncbi:topoisomerase C-terminal repeat-containing protein [Elizabethkingia anophelis]|nr:topoisomerase C-terminal repeat-containing protein [Elizabethkingia anophelis]MCT3994435.1 topoisomerase C-terminal repeat-containing protein [Elizabethkingia anophelis]MCT3997925.1 topoisomerase C-terminal repeat-containing protein [Elizabethkingia anophelis]MCT4254970.1 topoisomerase C-terminal repeat-containing protein [Elizabethkingia anophelis]
MKTVIAEKPSVAREIARILSANNKEDGYLSGNGYYVTWAIGHLVGLAMPEDYGISGFQKENLPILPDPFLLTARKIKKESGHTADTAALKQLKIINDLFNKSNEIIVATDAGREGELIFRYIYEYLNCTKTFDRLWISSLTDQAIREGFKNLKSGNDFDGLYYAAQARSQADWLVGINASQALSIAAGNGIYSLGRVQTPTLSLICRRYLDNKNFEIQYYWQIQLEHRKDFTDFKSSSKLRWNEKSQAEDTLRILLRTDTAKIVSVEKKTISEQPPLLFDLTGLQKEANNKLGLTAEETLKIAQILYENKFITYPRTGSQYIPEDMWQEIPALIRALEGKSSCKNALSKLKWERLNKRIVNDLKVTDHHGLLPTEKIPSALSAKENAIYDMIALRLLESVSPICTKELTDVLLQALHYDFTMKGSIVMVPGWRAIKGSFSDEDTESLQRLPDMKTGDVLKIKNAILEKKNSKPPLLYSEATLLSAMENAGKEIENEDVRKAIQRIGIGTPATRASIIETLLARNYIVRDKKNLIPTEKGLLVYELIKDKKIADVAMTAEWELALQQIENKELDTLKFKKQIEEYATNITRELLQLTITRPDLPALTCPKCKQQQLVIFDKIVKCPDESCKWLQFRNICGVLISITDIENLINNGRTSLIKGLKSKAGNKFNAFILLNDKAESSFEIVNNKPKRK